MCHPERFYGIPLMGHCWFFFFWWNEIFHHRDQGHSSCLLARGAICISSLFVEYYIYHPEITVALLQSPTTLFPWPSFARRKISLKKDLRKHISCCCALQLTRGYPSGPFLPGPERPARAAQTPALYTATATAVAPLIAVFQRVRPVSRDQHSPQSCLLSKEQ